MTEISTYKEALDFLYNNLPMFQRQGAPAMKKDLTNIRLLCSKLDNPQDTLRCLHIAGTNGKGSVTHMLSAMLQSQGFRVGVYTSPHYKDFRERIKINTALVDRKWVVRFLQENMEIIQKIKPSFFEISVAMAFAYFAEQEVDYAIIEVGLGGRLDSTNIIHPIVSVITNISKDHTQFLGESLPEIAAEKAGIIKENVPVIIGEKQEEVISVFQEKAREKNCDISFASDEVNVLYDELSHEVSVRSSSFNFSFEALWFTDYQRVNLQTAIKTYDVLQARENISTHKDQLFHYLQDLPEKTYFLGRWMTLGLDPQIITDSAHNQAGISILLKKLAGMDYTKLHCVLGFSDDKDLSSVLPLFPRNAKYYFAKADIPRGLDANKLKKQAILMGLKGRAYVSVKNAFKAAKRNASSGDLIYVGGSIFVVAEVLP